MRRGQNKPGDTWRTIYWADWVWLPEMVDMKSGDGLGEDYKAIARTRTQTRQWKPDFRWPSDWYHKAWPTGY